MFYEGEELPDDAGGGFEASLEALEQQSAQRIQDIVAETEDLLYANSDREGSEDEVEAADSEAIEGNADIGALGEGDSGFRPFDYDRHCGIGYNAHHDGVDPHEVFTLLYLIFCLFVYN